MTSATTITSYIGTGLAAARPSSPTVPAGCSALYFETDTGLAFVWSGSAWVQLGASASPLFGIGGFGNNSLGTLLDTLSFVGVLSAFGSFTNVPCDTTHQPTLVSGHVYRVVFYTAEVAGNEANFGINVVGSNSGYLLGTYTNSSLGGSGLAMGVYKAAASSFTLLGSGDSWDVTAGNMITEFYIYVAGTSANVIWGGSFGVQSGRCADTSINLAGVQVEFCVVLPAGGSVNTAYLYDLGVVPTS
jgi:hypothetical protein